MNIEERMKGLNSGDLRKITKVIRTAEIDTHDPVAVARAVYITAVENLERSDGDYITASLRQNDRSNELYVMRRTEEECERITGGILNGTYDI